MSLTCGGILCGRAWEPTMGSGFWFRVCGARGASLVCAGRGRGAVTEVGVAGGFPPHKGRRLRLTAPLNEEGRERSEE